jgi:hypothetical protein
MKSLKQLAVLAIFGALACAGLQAQTVDLRATIPFDFQAGNTLMPAGEYLIHSQGQWVVLRKADGGKPAAGLMTNAATGANPTRGEARLDFNRYGDAYFLTAIWNGYSRDGRQVPQTGREKELAKRLGGPVQAAAIRASKPSNQ